MKFKFLYKYIINDSTQWLVSLEFTLR